MCLYVGKEQTQMFLEFAKDKPRDGWVIGWKVFRFGEAYYYRDGFKSEVCKHSVMTPFMCRPVTKQVLEANKIRRKMIMAKDLAVEEGIHFYTKKDCAIRCVGFNSGTRFVVKVYVQIKDVVAVGDCGDAVANRVVIDDKDWKKRWVNNGADK